MRRRDFIKVIAGSAATLPFAARAQQQTLPVIGYLSFTSPEERPTLLAAFRQGLEQAGFVIGQNVTIEYRSAAGNYERLPALAAELVKIPRRGHRCHRRRNIGACGQSGNVNNSDRVHGRL